ncbi:hypothetical protein [Brumimicrobium oceani]|uniref:Uncharacterized protein n=1 Tax=Brumimicrobium oceani TaxID=2100725 RepID=A0A2U2XB61_9FLAO|nr:hypothetical protein [Brumimicrobium oceani]PWH85022.1 hypothetical protein DIT68_11670 [Brumimicrobium oceani]
MSEAQIFQDDLLNSLTNPNWKNESIEVAKSKAYNDGFKKGMNVKELALKNFFISNIEKATLISEEVYKKFNESGFICKQMILKAIDLKSFDVLCIIDKESYLSEARKIVYKSIREIKKANNSNEFFINFLMMPDGGEIDYSLIKSEGFTLKYEPKTR